MRDQFARDVPDNNDLERTYRQIMRGVKNRNIEFGTHNINIEYQSGNGIRYKTVKYDENFKAKLFETLLKIFYVF